LTTQRLALAAALIASATAAILTLTACFETNAASSGLPRWASYDDSCPAWSPDGKTLAFASSRGRSPLTLKEALLGLSQYNLFVVDVAGTHGRRLTRLSARSTVDYASPTWSHDGRTIAFQLVSPRALANYDSAGSALVGQVYEVNATGSPHLRAAPDAAAAVFAFTRYPDQSGDYAKQFQCRTHSSDGKKVAFYRLIDTGAGLGGFGLPGRLGVVCVMNADGSGERRITQFVRGASSTCPNTRR